MPSQQRLKLDLQEKNALYFRILDAITSGLEPRSTAKMIFEVVNGVWEEKIIGAFEPENSLNPKKKPSFKRVE